MLSIVTHYVTEKIYMIKYPGVWKLSLPQPCNKMGDNSGCRGDGEPHPGGASLSGSGGVWDGDAIIPGLGSMWGKCRDCVV